MNNRVDELVKWAKGLKSEKEAAEKDRQDTLKISFYEELELEYPQLKELGTGSWDISYVSDNAFDFNIFDDIDIQFNLAERLILVFPKRCLCSSKICFCGYKAGRTSTFKCSELPEAIICADNLISGKNKNE